ncbi:MAG: DUF4177 domain-containing protein [Pseudoxanthomonas sp.]
MSTRWNHKVVEVSFSLFGSKLGEKIQMELDKFGALGWELVAVTQTSAADVVRLYFKKEQ